MDEGFSLSILFVRFGLKILNIFVILPMEICECLDSEDLLSIKIKVKLNRNYRNRNLFPINILYKFRLSIFYEKFDEIHEIISKNFDRNSNFVETHHITI